MTPSSSATGARFGASEMILPTLRSRLAQPSSRLPMPGANELSTVEWHSEHRIPTPVSLPDASNAPDAHDCVELEQREGRRRIFEIDLACLDLP